MKMQFIQYRKSHCGDKTAVRLSYIHNGIPFDVVGISYTTDMTFHMQSAPWLHICVRLGRYPMMTSSNRKKIPRYWPFVRRIHWSPVNSPHKGQWRGTLMFPLICACTNTRANSREAGDLRRHRAHYDVIVMCAGYVFSPNSALFQLVYTCQGYPGYFIEPGGCICWLNSLWVVMPYI